MKNNGTKGRNRQNRLARGVHVAALSPWGTAERKKVRAGLTRTERAFFLDDVDKALVTRRRGDHTRLGFALQLTTVRFLGTFLPEPLDVPVDVVAYLTEQLGIADASCVERYTTPFEHVEEIKAAYGLRDFAEVTKELEAWVDARAWTTGTARRPSSPTR